MVKSESSPSGLTQFTAEWNGLQPTAWCISPQEDMPVQPLYEQDVEIPNCIALGLKYVIIHCLSP